MMSKRSYTIVVLVLLGLASCYISFCTNIPLRLFMRVRWGREYAYSQGVHQMLRPIGKYNGIDDSMVEIDSSVISVNVLGLNEEDNGIEKGIPVDSKMVFAQVVIQNNSEVPVTTADLCEYRLEQKVFGEWIYVPNGVAFALIPGNTAPGETEIYEVPLTYVKYGVEEIGNVKYCPLKRGRFRILVKVGTRYYGTEFELTE